MLVAVAVVDTFQRYREQAAAVVAAMAHLVLAQPKMAPPI
jgi:hypothetical protein